MSDLATLHHFKFNSDFPADMISYYHRWDFSVPAYGAGTVSYNHNLPYTPLVFGVWSNNDAFTNSRPCSEGWFGINIYADATKIYAQYDLSTKSTATNVKMRVYGYTPSTYTKYTPASSDSSTPLILSSDENYAPLIFEGCFTSKIIQSGQPSTSLGFNIKNGYQKQTGVCNEVDIYHDLPKLPSVMLWGENPSTGVIKAVGMATYDYYSGWRSNVNDMGVKYADGLLILSVGVPYQQSEVQRAHIRIYA